MINITLPDSSKIQAEPNSSLYDIIGKIGKSLQKAAICASVDGEMKDLAFVPAKDFSLKVFTFKDKEGKATYWHSTSHVMAQAIKRLYPDAKLAIGPAVDDGFYYDLDMPVHLTVDDLAKIEKEMEKISAEALPVTREEVATSSLKAEADKNGDIYKAELLAGIDSATVSVYRQGEFADMCRGPHVSKTSDIKAFKLTKIAGAYWRGDEKNKMLQRIYGISFPDKKDLEEHLRIVEEAKERDHRKIGKELELFEMSPDVGAGLTLWTPKGGRIRVAIENFWRREHYKNGYDIVYTPHIGRSQLWQTSGHLVTYKEGMFSPMDVEGEDYYVKPMNCPFHIEIYKSQKRSYREFPMRWAELGTVYRFERSGTMHGLMRVRGFTQDDAHLFCRVDQLEAEITTVFNFSLSMLKKFGFDKFTIKLSTRPEADYVGTVEVWDKAESILKSVLETSAMPYVINHGDGAFYGPKIDIAVKDAIGRDWQLSTVQLDFNLPQRFELTYTGSDGKEHQPIMIHRALLGSLERFFGILIEHYKGAFPAWLAPVQAVLINVGETESGAVVDLKNRMIDEGMRPEVDLSAETMGYKIRNAVTSRVPYVVVIGKKEVEDGTVSVRARGENNSVTMKVEEFIDMVKIQSR